MVVNFRIVPGSAPAGADAPRTGTKLTRATPSAASSHLIFLMFCLLWQEPRQHSAGSRRLAQRLHPACRWRQFRSAYVRTALPALVIALSISRSRVTGTDSSNNRRPCGVATGWTVRVSASTTPARNKLRVVSMPPTRRMSPGPGLKQMPEGELLDPAKFLHGPARVPDLGHVADLAALKLHHVDIVAAGALAG